MLFVHSFLVWFVGCLLFNSTLFHTANKFRIVLSTGGTTFSLEKAKFSFSILEITYSALHYNDDDAMRIFIILLQHPCRRIEGRKKVLVSVNWVDLLLFSELRTYGVRIFSSTNQPSNQVLRLVTMSTYNLYSTSAGTQSTQHSM